MRYALSSFTTAILSIFCFCAHAQESSDPLTVAKWTPISTEFTRVQTGDWLNKDRFVVGRWDGTVSVFRKPKASELTPVLVDVFRTSDGSGVEMLHTLDESSFLASNGSSSLKIWSLGGQSPGIDLHYDSAFGVANSAVSGEFDGNDLIVTGHAQGYILIWRRAGSKIELVRSLNLNSPNPIPSPFPLKNIRGLATWGNSHIVAGSEDGDLTIIRIADDTVTLRMRYNEKALRGINSISIDGDYLLLANCSVGPNDKNLWLYRIDAENEVVLVDAIDLKDDLTRPQSFNFDADLVGGPTGYQFYASTEEGLLWAGRLEDNKLVAARSAFVASEGGAFLDFNQDLSTLLAAARKIYLFNPL